VVAAVVAVSVASCTHQWQHFCPQRDFFGRACGLLRRCSLALNSAVRRCASSCTAMRAVGSGGLLGAGLSVIVNLGVKVQAFASQTSVGVRGASSTSSRLSGSLATSGGRLGAVREVFSR